MNRRKFLSTSLAASTAAGAPSRIRVGFLGASHSHAADKIRIARESADWELAGIWEPDPVLRTQFAKQGLRLVEREALLGDPGIPVIAVESEVKPHAEYARLALEAGKHVHLEKPPAVNMADMRALVELAGRKRLLLQMGYMWRYHPGINAALDAARKGWLGDVYLVRGTMNTLIGADRRPEWALFHGGQMFEQGAHLIDPLVRLLGRSQKVTHFLRHHGAFADNLFDNTVAVFDYQRAMGIICSAVLQPGATAHRTFEILGSNGTAVVRPIEQPPTLRIDLAKAAGPYQAGAQEVSLGPFRRYSGDFVELAEAVRGARPLAITPQEDLLVQEALLRASDMWS